MGRHEEPLTGRADGTFWDTVWRIARLPAPFLVMLFTSLIGLGILAVVIQNAYGDIWGALISAFLGLLVVSMLLRSRLRRRDPGPH
jgi:hypothetical protein